MEAAEGRIQDIIQDRCEDNDAERIEVTNEVVRHTIRLEHCG